jgi:hypothetical protein
MIDRIISKGFQDIRDPAEMIQKVSGTMYHWADEVINTKDGDTVLMEMTKVFRMAINIMNNVQH